MDFEFTPEQEQFAVDVEEFLDANDDPDVFDVTRENMAQIVDTPKRRAFMKSLGHKGWLGITWPEEYGGTDGEDAQGKALQFNGLTGWKGCLRFNACVSGCVSEMRCAISTFQAPFQNCVRNSSVSRFAAAVATVLMTLI